MLLLPIMAIPTAIAPVNAVPTPLFIAQTLLPPPPAGPNPVPDPSQFQFTANASSYRVLALVTSSVQEKQVKVNYPGAFYTNHNGRRMLQIGSFSDPLNAQQAALTLQNLGLETAIDP
ncbi:MAG: hypothetical protein VKL20_08215 [Synechocystis sp.]|nr:hypothetical protein [Synechocystis sp.]